MADVAQQGQEVLLYPLGMGAAIADENVVVGIFVGWFQLPLFFLGVSDAGAVMGCQPQKEQAQQGGQQHLAVVAAG